MIAIFDNELNDDAVAEFCDEVCNKIYTLREGDYLDIYFSTNGGENSNRIPILDLIVKYQDYIKVHLKSTMSSNGFLLLMELLENNIEVYMTKEFLYSMIHKTDASLNNHRPYGYEHILNNSIKKYNLNVAKRLKKLGLTDEQINEYNKGNDIYFSPEETLKLFPNIIKNK